MQVSGGLPPINDLLAAERRVVVVGNTGAGKTTFAQRLADVLGVGHVELDSLHWQAGWRPAETEEFRQAVARAVSGDGWVADGNYRKVRDVLWTPARWLIWLDYPMTVCAWRLLCRTIRRTARGEVLWNGNRERFREQFFTRDSLFWWLFTTHRRRRREFEAVMADPEYRHLTCLRFRSPAAAERWLRDLGRKV